MTTRGAPMCLSSKAGGAIWGRTEDEALRNIQEVSHMVIEAMLGNSEVLPDL
jgi:hypothetical protein